MVRWFRVTWGIILLAFSFFLFLGSNVSMTGAFIGAMPSGSTSVFAIVAAMVSGVIFASSIGTNLRVRSVIGKDKTLVKLAEEATNNSRAQTGLDSLTNKLVKGHTPGRIRHINDTDVFYVGKDDARLYYRQVHGGYDIVAKSKKGKNQDQVIHKLHKIYKK